MEQNKEFSKPFLKPIGIIHSELKNREDCPFQESEGAPAAWLEIFPDFTEGLEGIVTGKEVILLTWLHLANREILKCHVRDHWDSEPVGVFTTRSPDRPNPIGLHLAKILEIDSNKNIKISYLEVIDGTLLLDIKPVIKR